MDFAAHTIGTMLLMLKERYTDAEIKKMLTTKKVSGALKILNQNTKLNQR